jgi:alpha-glucosidase
VLAGVIGKYVVVARRRGCGWFVGAMTNEGWRVLRVPLDFLGRGRYALKANADGEGAAADPQQLSVSNVNVQAGDALTLKLAPGGGYAAQLMPVR